MHSRTALVGAQKAHPVLIHLSQLKMTLAHLWMGRPQRGLSFLHCTTGEIFRVAFHMLPPNIRFSGKPRASR